MGRHKVFIDPVYSPEKYKKESNKIHKCVICDKEFKGFGNNALPIKSGLCCNKCNHDVIRERVRALRGRK